MNQYFELGNFIIVIYLTINYLINLLEEFVHRNVPYNQHYSV
jgi:hypothetical protein